VRARRPAVHATRALAALALAAALSGCSDEAVAPEQGVDVGDATPPAPATQTEDPGVGDGQVGVDGTN
jgi:hypothetical protein